MEHSYRSISASLIEKFPQKAYRQTYFRDMPEDKTVRKPITQLRFRARSSAKCSQVNIGITQLFPSKKSSHIY